MATNMDLVSIATSLLVLYLTSLNTGNAGIIRRDVPPIAIPMNPTKPSNQTSKAADSITAKNCSIEVVAFIPFTDKQIQNDVNQTEPVEKTVHESYPNPPVPTPPKPVVTKTIVAQNEAEVTSQPEKNADGTKKWGFDDKYLASQNKYAVRRNVVYDVVAGDTMSFSNYNVLGHQEGNFGKK